MSLREEFVKLAQMEETNMSQLCQEYGISRKTGYKWLGRSLLGMGMDDLSKRPHHTPKKINDEMEQVLIDTRKNHPTWGPRKIKRVLENKSINGLPSISTISEVFKRNGLIDTAVSLKHRAYAAFESPSPNDLWQMDFKGNRSISKDCNPLSVLDDHSRYLLGLRSCRNQQRETVAVELTQLFREYGMPIRFLMDNGSPWGSCHDRDKFTALEVWLLRLDIEVTHGRAYHPQTQGKVERFHRTFEEYLTRACVDQPFDSYQTYFDAFREEYNNIRPHEAIDMDVPTHKYIKSTRIFPETIPPILYDTGSIVRKVDVSGRISFKNREWKIGKAFYGLPVALVPAENVDGVFRVFFMKHILDTIDLAVE